MSENNLKYFIDDRIFSQKFVCDLDKCKGACCTIKGTIGAPINDEEVDIIKYNIKYIWKYLSDINKKVIEERNFYEIIDGELSLNIVNDNDCVFSYIEEGIAKCVFQKAYNLQEIRFKKPISCELFPIRIRGENKNELRFEMMYECKDALEKGKDENISVYGFVKDAIVRKFGNEFYKHFNNI